MPSTMADEQTPSLVGQLLRAVGGWTTPSGKGLFMFRMMTFGASCAGICGVSAAFLSSVFYGPIGSIAFAIGSSIGWIAAAIYGWRTSVAHSLIAYDQYPKLMLIHMTRSFRLMGLERVKLDSPEDVANFRYRLVNDLRYKSMLVGAYETAAPLIDEIEARREAKVIAELAGERD
ncbi:hypothetical protein DPSP01_009580 [Paraphaeosphaeria sporulosa]